MTKREMLVKNLREISERIDTAKNVVMGIGPMEVHLFNVRFEINWFIDLNLGNPDVSDDEMLKWVVNRIDEVRAINDTLYRALRIVHDEMDKIQFGKANEITFVGVN